MEKLKQTQEKKPVAQNLQWSNYAKLPKDDNEN